MPYRIAENVPLGHGAIGEPRRNLFHPCRDPRHDARHGVRAAPRSSPSPWQALGELSARASQGLP
eukprot:gene5364-2759_t